MFLVLAVSSPATFFLKVWKVDNVNVGDVVRRFSLSKF